MITVEFYSIGRILEEAKFKSMADVQASLTEMLEESFEDVDEDQPAFAKVMIEGKKAMWFDIDEAGGMAEITDEVEAAELEESFNEDEDETFLEMFNDQGWFEDLMGDVMESLDESTVRRVSSDGSVRRTKSKAVRKRQAGRTTGMSKAQRARRGKQAARTRRKDRGGQARAQRKTKKAVRRRRQMGVKSGT